MYKKFLLPIALLLFCFSNSIAANGFFFEGGIGSRYINGQMNYDLGTESDYLTDFEISRDPLIESPLGNSVTDDLGLGWKSKFVGNYNATIGFHLSNKFVTALSVHYFGTKTGFGLNLSRSYSDVNVELGENIQRGSLETDIANNWFSQINLRLTQHLYVDNSLFLIAGVEYSSLKFEKYVILSGSSLGGVIHGGTSYDADNNRVTYKDYTIGMFAGLGYELPLSSKTSLMVTGVYSMSNYNGDELFYNNLEFDIGGVELGYTLRYYLK